MKKEEIVDIIITALQANGASLRGLAREYGRSRDTSYRAVRAVRFGKNGESLINKCNAAFPQACEAWRENTVAHAIQITAPYAP
jgi:lambda repressor-like predicted transcriptional regulator